MADNSEKSTSSEELDSKLPPTEAEGPMLEEDTFSKQPTGHKRKTGGSKQRPLIKKRYRTEQPLSPPSLSHHEGKGSGNVRRDEAAASKVAAGVAATSHQHQPSETSMSADMFRAYQRTPAAASQQIQSGNYAGARSNFAEHPFALQPAVGTRSTAPQVPDALFASLAPSAREILLREQLIRDRQTALLMAQMGYNADRPTLMQERALPPDLLQRYLSISGLTQQAEYWRNPGSLGPGFGDLIGTSLEGALADQYRLQLLQQQRQHQQQHQHQQHQQQHSLTQQHRQQERGLCNAVEQGRPSPPQQSIRRPTELLRREGPAQLSVARRPDVEGDVDLPPCTEGPLPSLASRRTFPLGIDEDVNWLSEFHCFIRAELIEVFQASHEDVKARNTAITYKQVGLRCRYCAHRTGAVKAGRSSAFPSSIRQIYQSFTMMLRDHFPNCDAITGEAGERYTLLKDKPSQGATDSKRYWIYSGLKIGMADSNNGIYISKETRSEGLASLPFGVDPNSPWRDDMYAEVSLVTPSDREEISDFIYLLMSQVQPIRLTEAECIGNRRSLRVGLPGFGCRFCCQQRRLGLCRMFPARRRTLPTKIFDFYDHIRRCPLCPSSLKVQLVASKQQVDEKQITDQGKDRQFFDRVWTRLGHESPPPT